MYLTCISLENACEVKWIVIQSWFKSVYCTVAWYLVICCNWCHILWIVS